VSGVDNYLTFSSLIGDSTEAYRIVIAYTEIEIHIGEQEHDIAFSDYKPYFVRPDHIYSEVGVFNVPIHTIFSFLCFRRFLYRLTFLKMLNCFGSIDSYQHSFSTQNISQNQRSI